LARNGEYTLVASLRRQQKFLLHWLAPLSLILSPEAVVALDAYYNAINALLTAIGEVPHGG